MAYEMRISDWSSDVCSSDLGAVDELVDDDEGAGREILAQRADGAERHDLGDAGALQGVDVGTGVQRRGRQLVAAAVARQEHQPLAVQLAAQQRIGGRAEGRLDAAPLGVAEALDLVDRSAEHTSELPSLMRNSYAVFCLK